MDYSAMSAEELVHTCLHSGDEPAWVEFVRRFQPLIARVVFRIARQWGESGSSVIDDLIQETYLKLCADGLRVLRTFKPEHPDAIYGYIKVLAANLAHDHFKAAHSKKRGGGTVPDSTEGKDLGLKVAAQSSSAALERQILIGQIDSCLKRVASERDRRIFWLYYRVGLAASAIGCLPNIGLTTKGVESTLLRLTRDVREQLAQGRMGTAAHGSEGIQSAESL